MSYIPYTKYDPNKYVGTHLLAWQAKELGKQIKKSSKDLEKALKDNAKHG